MIGEYLESEGLTVMLASDGVQALEMLDEQPVDLLVLDIMMPGMNGIDVLKQLRNASDLPVIMLTARGDDLDRILGLELGADDYLAKPCNPRELYARIRAVLRRILAHDEAQQGALNIGDIFIEPATRGVRIDAMAKQGKAKEVSLTQTEFDLLYLLLSSPGKLVSKSEMSIRVLDKPISQWDRSIDVHISNLRRKLGTHSDGSERIRTLRGSGYLYQQGNSNS